MATPLIDKLFPGRDFVTYVLGALETKSNWTGGMTVRYLQRSAMAGIIIALMYVGNYAISAGFAEMTVAGQSLAFIGKLSGALVFGFALVFIYFTRSELLTSNMMVVSVGMYYRKTGFARAMRIMGLCYLGNFIGALLIAALLALSTILDGATMELMEHSVEHKLEYLHSAAGWGDLMVRAIFCNLLINLAMGVVYTGAIKDGLGKTIIIVDAIFVFVFLGFEHSVANTALFLMVAVQHGIDLAPAIGNLVIALIGNFIGGGILVGLFYAYLNDDSGYAAAEDPRTGNTAAVPLD